jgi:hypothetical protein
VRFGSHSCGCCWCPGQATAPEWSDVGGNDARQPSQQLIRLRDALLGVLCQSFRCRQSAGDVLPAQPGLQPLQLQMEQGVDDVLTGLHHMVRNPSDSYPGT